MASSSRQAETSDDDAELLILTRRTKKRKRRAVSSSSDTDDSDIQVRPKTRRGVRKICESDSETDDEMSQCSDSGQKKRRAKRKKKVGNDDAGATSVNESSDGEQSEKCAICLGKFTGQEVATPETCDHIFCSECLQQWAKKVNTCPIDRKSFRMVLIRNHGSSKVVRKIFIESCENFVLLESDSSDSTYCEMCGESDNEETLLLCDECELGFHCECLIPPLDAVPEGRWICPYCAPYIEIRERMLRDFQDLVARRFRPFLGAAAAIPDIPQGVGSFHVGNEEQNGRAYSDTEDFVSSQSSSDEHSETSVLSRRRRRRRCEEVRNRRQSRYLRSHGSTSGPLSVTLSPLSSSSVVFGSEINNSGDYVFDYDDDDGHGGGGGGGNVVSAISHRRSQSAVARTKSLISNGSLASRSSSVASSTLRLQSSSSSSGAVPSNVDIVGEILELQSLLHGTHSSSQTQGSTGSSSNPVVQQCPMNPPRDTPSKCGGNESLQPNSSSSSSSGSVSSQCQDLDSVPRSSMLGDSVASADGYDSDSLSMVTHRSYGSASMPDEFRKDCPERDSRRSHSDDDVDIYSDIELANDEETSLDAEMRTMSMSYESDESRIPVHRPAVPVGADGTDSSDNDLVIDEDANAEEEAARSLGANRVSMKLNGKSMREGSSSEVARPEDSSGEMYVPDHMQSPGEFGSNSQDANSDTRESSDSCDSIQDGQYAEEHIGNSEDSQEQISSRHQESLADNISQENSRDAELLSPVDGEASPHGGDVRSLSRSSYQAPLSSSEWKEEEEALLSDEPRDEEAEECSQDAKFADESMSEVEQTTPTYDQEEHTAVAEQSHELSDVNESDRDEGTLQGSIDKDDSEENIEIAEASGPLHAQCPENSNADGDTSNSVLSFEDAVKLSQQTQETYCYPEPPPDFTKESKLSLKCHPEAKQETMHQELKAVACTSGGSVQGENKKHSGGGVAEDGSKPSPSSENHNISNFDLGIEDISDVASDELNQPEGSMDYDQFSTYNQSAIDNVERNVAQLFDSNDSSSKGEHKKFESSGSARGEHHRYSTSSRQLSSDDHEEGEIIEETSFRRKETFVEHYEDAEEYTDLTPKVSISDLPRIPKIKKKTMPEEPPLEVKRLSVLDRIDLGSSDISWKRLSQHTRERSYRDGRPKDESIMFREREPRAKDKKSKSNVSGKSEDGIHNTERNKSDEKKQNRNKSKDRGDHREKKSERSRNEYEKPSKQDEWSYSSGERPEKSGKSHKEKHSREKSKKDKKKDKHDKKDKSSRDRDRSRSEDRYSRDIERYEASERTHEKREKEHKHKHHKSESKKSKEEKHKHGHSSDHYYHEKQRDREREVRKVDDKLKVVVEHKDPRKEKDKHAEKKESKHEKKHAAHHHHHECKKKEPIASPYSEVTPIESKEIFAQGDSIIINVSFNRSSPRDVPTSSEESVCKEWKTTNSEDVNKSDYSDHKDDYRRVKSKHSSFDKERTLSDDVGHKRSVTPTDRSERSVQLLPVGERYWQESDDGMDVKSLSEEKSPADKTGSDDDDENSVSPACDYAPATNLSDSEDNCGLPETQEMLGQNADETSSPPLSFSKQSLDNNSLKEKESENFVPARRRSPQPPSPPSPPENDSYDPCEPTRSPSPPSPPPAVPPLPSQSMADRPEPPPEPELPPLPPEPEPSDTLPREEPRPTKISTTLSISENSPAIISSPQVTQHLADSQSQTPTESVASLPSAVLPPPPSFPPHPPLPATTSQLVLPTSVTWQLPNPPPPPAVFSASHPQPVIRGSFLPSQFPTVGLPPPLPAISAAMLQSAASVPLMSPVRPLQVGPHAAIPGNQLMGGVPVNPLSLAQVQIPHVSHPIPSSTPAHHQLQSMPNSVNSHPPPVSSQVGVRALSSQSHTVNTTVPLQNQNAPSSMSQNAAHTSTPQSQPPPPPLVTAILAKTEKAPKNSPAKEKSEVVDMDVDSPYSPGDSPSMGSDFDYSPPSTPVGDSSATAVTAANAAAPGSKDPFDSLFDKPSGKASKNRASANSADTPSKKSKLDVKSDSSKVRHSVRLQVADKAKARKEKRAEKKELLAKLDDTQLKILDELPSSAVEMQVKEKFLKKLNRQERVVEEVKLALKPYYKTREVTKEEYKDILRKSVPKICHNKSGEINPVKVKHLVECYVKKVKHAKRKAEKRRKAAKFS